MTLSAFPSDSPWRTRIIRRGNFGAVKTFSILGGSLTRAKNRAVTVAPTTPPTAPAKPTSKIRWPLVVLVYRRFATGTTTRSGRDEIERISMGSVQLVLQNKNQSLFLLLLTHFTRPPRQTVSCRPVIRSLKLTYLLL